MVGPVLHHEMMLGSRRSRAYVFRWLYAGWLVLQVLGYYFYFAMASITLPDNVYATPTVASWFVETFVVQQLILLLLATPVFTAGALTDEKTRGTLQYLLTTDLLSWDIVAGKLLGRLAQVGLLVLTGLPLVCFLGVFCGVEPLALVALLLVSVMPLFALGAASILASVWSRQTRDAVLGLYVVGAVVVGAALWLGGHYLDFFNPLYVLEPAWGRRDLVDVGELAYRLAWSALYWGLIGVVCLASAVWRLRPAYVRQLESSGVGGSFMLPFLRRRDGRETTLPWWRGTRRLKVGDNPVPWKERYVEGLAPLPSLRRIPRWLAMLLIFAATTASSVYILSFYVPPGFSWQKLAQHAVRLELDDALRLIQPPPAGVAAAATPAGAFLLQSIVAMLLASLVVGIRCSGAISGERERQTWEALLLTPLSARQLVRGKLWGIIGASYLYLLAYAVPALALSALGGFAAFFWTVVWLAVTWLAMYFVGAAGIFCSVRTRSSWRSLLGTLGIGYVFGFFIYVLTTPVIFILMLLIVMFLFIIDQYLGTTLGISMLGGLNEYLAGFTIGSCLALAGIFFGLARFFLADAQKWVSERERTRHWKDEEPFYRRPRLQAPLPRYYPQK
jgi:ABC-type transport system involved in multi-copper enzyme maturation permease subunit